MKIEVPFLAALLLAGTNLMMRVQAFGIEQALFSTAMEFGLRNIRACVGLLPNQGWFHR